jgi:hypothetical protein
MHSSTEANDIVRPIHAKAMPVLLTTPEEWDVWLGGSMEDATALQKPLANDAQDEDLLNFSQQDAEDLQSIFMELVSELFIIPAATKKAREEFLARRKITPKEKEGPHPQT